MTVTTAQPGTLEDVFSDIRRRKNLAADSLAPGTLDDVFAQIRQRKAGQPPQALAQGQPQAVRGAEQHNLSLEQMQAEREQRQGDYDYASAEKAGITPDETGHWPSRVPSTGLILKREHHPTFGKTVADERAAGHVMYRNTDTGQVHSFPWNQEVPDNFVVHELFDPKTLGRAEALGKAEPDVQQLVPKKERLLPKREGEDPAFYSPITGYAAGMIGGAGAMARQPEVIAKAIDRGTKGTRKRYYTIQGEDGTPEAISPMTQEEITAYREKYLTDPPEWFTVGSHDHLAHEARLTLKDKKEVRLFGDLAKFADTADQIAMELREFTPGADKRGTWAWFMFNSGQALGSMTLMAGPGGLLKPAAKLSVAMAVTIAGAIESGSQYPEYAKKLKAKGWDDDSAERIAATNAIGYGIASSIVEVFPMMALFRKVPGLRGHIARMIQTAALEGGEEGVQTFLDKVTQVMADIDENAIRNLSREELQDAFMFGAIAGGGMAMVMPVGPGLTTEQTQELRWQVGEMTFGRSEADLAYSKSDLRTPQGLRLWMMQNPQAAREMAEKETISRSDIRKATRSTERWTADERAELAAKIKERKQAGREFGREIAQEQQAAAETAARAKPARDVVLPDEAAEAVLEKLTQPEKPVEQPKAEVVEKEAVPAAKAVEPKAEEVDRLAELQAMPWGELKTKAREAGILIKGNKKTIADAILTKEQTDAGMAAPRPETEGEEVGPEREAPEGVRVRDAEQVQEAKAQEAGEGEEAGVREEAVGKLGIDALVEQYNALGHSAYRYPRKKEISLDGRTMTEAAAVAKMRRVISAKPAPALPEKDKPYPGERRAAVSLSTFKNNRVLMQADGTLTHTVIDRIRRVWQDKFLPVQTLQKGVAQRGGSVTETTDTYLGEELMYSKLERGVRMIERRHVNPMLQSLKKSGLTRQDLSDYLYARHAPERNATIAERNKEMPEAGSGMTDEEASAIMASLEKDGKIPGLKRAARFIDRMNRTRLDMLEGAGLISAEQRAAWEALWKHYVPLRTADIDGQKMRLRAGRGLDIRGKESKEARGRRSEADDPVLFTIMQLNEAVIRAEKNRVLQRMLKFVESNEGIVPARVEKKKPTLVWNKETGSAEWRAAYDPLDADRTVSVKRDGVEYHVTFDDPFVTAALQNTGTQTMGSVVRAFAAVTRFYSQLHTSWNYEFVVSNFTRDIQTALINITSERDVAGAVKKIRRKIFKGTVPAIYGSMQELRNPGADNVWAGWFRDFEKVGGRVGWYHAKDFEQMAHDIERKLKQANAGDLASMREGMQVVLDYITDINSAVENGVRVSTYRTLVESGISKERAASVAKNLTVNFNRKGEAGATLNAFYIFANAGIQGTARLLRTMRTPAGRRVVGGIIAASAMWAVLNRLISDVDDDDELFYDKIPDHVKERNLVLMIPGTDGNYMKIPLPYGFNLFHVLGTELGDIGSRTMTGDEVDIWDSTKQVVRTGWSAYNPLGSGSLSQIVSPTVTDPIVQIGENRQFYGAPIYKEQPAFQAEVPESTLYWSSTGAIPKALSRWMNAVTGGDEITPGAIDINPDIIEHIAESLVGGAGATVKRTVESGVGAVKGDVNWPQVPVLRRFYGMYDERHTQSTFYDNYGEVEGIESRMKRYEAAGEHEKAKALGKREAAMLSTWPRLKDYRKTIKGMGDRLDSLVPQTEQYEKLMDARESLMKKSNKMVKDARGGKRDPTGTRARLVSLVEAAVKPRPREVGKLIVWKQNRDRLWNWLRYNEMTPAEALRGYRSHLASVSRGSKATMTEAVAEERLTALRKTLRKRPSGK